MPSRGGKGVVTTRGDAERYHAVEVDRDQQTGTEVFHETNRPGQARIRRGCQPERFRPQPRHHRHAANLREPRQAIEPGPFDVETMPAEPQRQSAIRAPLHDRIEEVHGGRTDESCHEAVARGVVEGAWRPDLLKQASVQNRHPRSHRHGLDLVVSDIDRRDAGSALECRDLLAHLRAQTGVEVGERFVHEKGVGRAHQRSRHGDPLPLTAGELGPACGRGNR